MMRGLRNIIFNIACHIRNYLRSKYYHYLSYNAINRVERFLHKKYAAEDCSSDDIDLPDILRAQLEYRNLKMILKYQEDNGISVIISIPNIFPDDLPKIYLSKADYERIYPIPHLDKNREICTRDREVVVLNDKDPCGAVNELIIIALSIIRDGIDKRYSVDFIEEFSAYWTGESKYHFLSIFDVDNNERPLKIFKLSSNLFQSRYIVAESKYQVLRWLAPLNDKILCEEKISALYLPISKADPFSLKIDGDVLALLKENNLQSYFPLLEKYFNEGHAHNIVISSIPFCEDRLVFGWRHKGWRNVTISGFRRNGPVPLLIRMNYSKDSVIQKIYIKKLDSNRLFLRGGYMKVKSGDTRSVAIVGCGAVGSNLAMSLARCGIQKYFLADNQILAPENIARHLCGMLDASKGLFKAEAVKQRITQHFPNIECVAYNGDILQLLHDQKESLDGYDLIIVAVGHLSVERRINDLSSKGLIKAPIIYIWMEPLDAGGQMLYLPQKEANRFSKCFDSNGDFSFSISFAPAGQTFLKREGGCRETFLPYNANCVDNFAARMTNNILHILDGQVKSGVLYTWFGDLEYYQKSGCKIRDIYIASYSPHGIYERKIA